MDEFKGFNPTDLPAARIAELQDKMAASFAVLSAAAVEAYGFANVKRLRDEYKQGVLTLRYNPRALRVLGEMMALEAVIIGGFIKVASDLCRAFALSHEARPGVTVGDYVQEAAWAIYDAMYTYNGENNFSTYVYWCVKNKLISFTRSEERVAKAKKRQRIDKEDVLALAVIDQRDDPNEDMRRAVEQTELTPLERELVVAYLNGQTRNDMCENRINPATQRPYTRQRLSQIFCGACAKIRETYERLQRRAAA